MNNYEIEKMIERGENEIDSIEHLYNEGKLTREEADEMIRDIEYDLAEYQRELDRREEFNNWNW